MNDTFFKELGSARTLEERQRITAKHASRSSRYGGSE